MTEKLTYSPDAQVFRRKTLTTAQKALLYLIVAANIGGTAGLALFSEPLEKSPYFWVALVAPTTITLMLITVIALNPRGPEANFILPGPEIDPEDCSTVVGKVRLPGGDIYSVEVVVPNVHGNSMIGSLLDTDSNTTSDQISTPEMFELALETVQLKYPDCVWEGEPSIDPALG